MKKILIITWVALLMFGSVFSWTACAENDGNIATPTNSAVIINGSNVNFCAYNIGGSNYFKLRDLAFALSNTEKALEVSYYQYNKSISLILNGEEKYNPYKPIGDELAPGDGQAKITRYTLSNIIYNGQEVNLLGYCIDDYNYFKLRDIAQLVDFEVEWNESADCIEIKTNSKYIADGFLSCTPSDSAPVIGNVYEARLPVFIDELPIISYFLETGYSNVTQEQLQNYKEYPQLRNQYIFADDLNLHGFDVSYNMDDNTLLISRNADKVLGMMDGERVNSMPSDEIVYQLYPPSCYVFMDGKRVDSYSTGDKTLISVTALLPNSILEITRYWVLSDEIPYMCNFDFMEKDLTTKFDAIPQDRIINIVRPKSSYTGYIADGCSAGVFERDKFFCENGEGMVNGIVKWSKVKGLNAENAYSFIGSYKDGKMNGHGILTFEVGYKMAKHLGFARGLYENDVLVDGISYESSYIDRSSGPQNGRRVEGSRINGYQRKSIVAYPTNKNARFGYMAQCEGEIRNGEFCGYYRQYDESGKLVFEGQYSDYLKTKQ